MANILSEQDTFFGSIAFRNKLISQKQLQKAVIMVQKTPGLRLGDAMVELGYMTQEQVNAILSMQNVQKKKFDEETPPYKKPPELQTPENGENDEGDAVFSTRIESDEVEPELEIETSAGFPQDAQSEEEPEEELEEELPMEASVEGGEDLQANPLGGEDLTPGREPQPDLPSEPEEELEIESPSDSLFSLPSGGESPRPTIKLTKPPKDLELEIENIAGSGYEEEYPEEESQDSGSSIDLSGDLDGSDLESAIAELEGASGEAPEEEDEKPQGIKPLPDEALAEIDEDDAGFQPFSPGMAIQEEAEEAEPEEAEAPAPEVPQKTEPPLQKSPAPAAESAPATAAPPSAPTPPPAEVVEEDVPANLMAGDPNRLERLEDFLAYARNVGASDLHISADVKPFMRLHGQIVPMNTPILSAYDTERLLFSVLSTRQKSMLMHDHGLEICLDLSDGRYRSVFYKQRCGLDANFHIIGSKVPTFEELGLPPALKRLTEYNQGLALVTGPSNSGKTTTLAALIDVVNHTRDDHVITVEKPVEYVHTPDLCQLTQREVGTHTESFSIALRAALREDPDIIMVGELRDLETLSIAITASETGHLVFGTLPTISAANTVSRIVDGFPVGQQAQIRMMLSESLRGIISQQLVPKKDGSGVALAMEILFITSAVSALIRDNQPHQIPSVIQTSRKIGMCRLDDSLMELVQNNVISGREAYRRADNKTPFEMYKNQD